MTRRKCPHEEACARRAALPPWGEEGMLPAPLSLPAPNTLCLGPGHWQGGTADAATSAEAEARLVP